MGENKIPTATPQPKFRDQIAFVALTVALIALVLSFCATGMWLIDHL